MWHRRGISPKSASGDSW
ncbi:MAG: hypothetical protein HQL79_09245 [Magnetococcales bacterium]|nr:hypothetical protein [Magnetococcales bacterium]